MILIPAWSGVILGFVQAVLYVLMAFVLVVAMNVLLLAQPSVLALIALQPVEIMILILVWNGRLPNLAQLIIIADMGVVLIAKSQAGLVRPGLVFILALLTQVVLFAQTSV